MPEDEGVRTDGEWPEGSCAWVREHLELFAYGDLAAEDASTVESHLSSCGGCRGERVSIERLRADLDQLPLPLPSEAGWACLESRLETRVAPLRARRLASGGRGASFWRWSRRVAAALLVCGLGATPPRLYQENARQQDRLVAVTRDLADLKFATGDVRGAYEGYAWAVRAGALTGAGAARYALKDQVLALPARLPALWSLARSAAADEQARLLTEVLWEFPVHPFADEAYVALRSIRPHQPARLRPLEAVCARALGVLGPRSEAVAPAAHLRTEVERLASEAEGRPTAVRLWVWMRAARIAEADLVDPALAKALYLRVTRQADRAGLAGPVPEYAAQRLAKLGG